MKIVFFGSAHFAVPSLEALIKSREDLLCVVTQPDKKKGRHLHLAVTDVKSTALKAKLKVFQPEEIKSAQSAKFLKSLKADIFVIVAYGQMLSQEILDIPKMFSINIHASLLPKYRGAAPINRAIINGDKTCGVTIMQVAKKMDSGALILQKEIPLADEDTAISIEEELRCLGAQLLLEALRSIKSGNYKLTPQDESKVVMAPKLKKEDGLINWDRPASAIYNQIRGVMPWPGAFTHYKGKLLKVHRVKGVQQDICFGEHSPGEVVGIYKEGIVVATAKHCLILEELQLEGGRRMSAREFVLGHKVCVGGRFE
ncbi:MAG: methionyl-tRNA formyltransferase [Candidatus Omnitrophota bacterium]